MPVVVANKQNAFNRKNTPAWGFVAITTSDTDDVVNMLRGFMVTGGGDVQVTGYDGSTAVIPGCIPGVQYWALITRVWSTNTTATGIVGML